MHNTSLIPTVINSLKLIIDGLIEANIVAKPHSKLWKWIQKLLNKRRKKQRIGCIVVELKNKK